MEKKTASQQAAEEINARIPDLMKIKRDLSLRGRRAKVVVLPGRLNVPYEGADATNHRATCMGLPVCWVNEERWDVLDSDGLTILDFIEARLNEMEARADEAILALDDPWAVVPGLPIREMAINDRHIVAGLRKVIEQHKSWLVLLESEPTHKVMRTDDVNSIGYFMYTNIRVLTEEKYRELIGKEPPTAPMIRTIANMWAYHEDYNENW